MCMCSHIYINMFLILLKNHIVLGKRRKNVQLYIYTYLYVKMILYFFFLLF